MIDLVQYRFRIGTYTGMGAKGSGRLNSGQFHDSSVFNPYYTSESLLFYTFDNSSGFWMTNVQHKAHETFLFFMLCLSFYVRHDTYHFMHVF